MKGSKKARPAFHFCAVLILGMILAIGCSDDLNQFNAVGGFPRTDVIIHDDTVYAIASSTFRRQTPTNGRVNYVGKFDGYTSYMMLQFYQSLFPNRDTIAVISATLKLRAVAWFGNPSATIGFTAHKITEPWNEVILDSLPAYDPLVRGTYTGTITADTAEVTMDLDTALVREWMRPSTFTQYGILLAPTVGSNVMRGFHCFNLDSTKFYPTLVVIARNNAGTVQDTTTFNLGMDTFVGSNNTPVSNPELIFTQSGAIHRSKILFDVSFIPTGAIINSADLVLVQDTTSSRLNKFTPDSVIIAHVLTSPTDSTLIEIVGTPGEPLSHLKTNFSVDIRHAVQSWVIGPNYGLVVRRGNLSELASFDLITFYNHVATNTALRPRIRIRYAIEPGQD
ncbi:MAG: hypothetical protein ACKVRP_12880 [Bacteroidota bacterium]